MRNHRHNGRRSINLIWGLALLGLSLVALPALAQIHAISHSGAWEAFGGVASDGNQTCGISTAWGDGRNLVFKVFENDPALYAVLEKGAWHIPPRTLISLVMSFDRGSPWSVNTMGTGTFIMFTVVPSQAGEFARLVMTSSAMMVSFPSGSEQPWTVNMSGTTVAGSMMLACMHRLPGWSAPNSQPYGNPSPPSQPFGQAPTQPAPVPLTPPAPAPTSDDGSDHV
jgi:hypothetical protein